MRPGQKWTADEWIALSADQRAALRRRAGRSAKFLRRPAKPTLAEVEAFESVRVRLYREELAEADRERQRQAQEQASAKMARHKAAELAAELYRLKKVEEEAERHREWKSLSQSEKFERMRPKGHNYGDGWN